MITFNKEDYPGWLGGVLVLGGFLVNPLLYMLYRKIGYLNALVPSLAVSFIVAISMTRNGKFSWIRLVIALGVILAARHFYYMKTGTLFEAGGGFIMVLVTFVCGLVGTEAIRIFHKKRNREK